jgi:hypothetical protein
MESSGPSLRSELRVAEDARLISLFVRMGEKAVLRPVLADFTIGSNKSFLSQEVPSLDERKIQHVLSFSIITSNKGASA